VHPAIHSRKSWGNNKKSVSVYSDKSRAHVVVVPDTIFDYPKKKAQQAARATLIIKKGGAISMLLPAYSRLPVAPPSPITARETLSAFRQKMPQAVALDQAAV
jgi:hypothetical protein